MVVWLCVWVCVCVCECARVCVCACVCVVCVCLEGGGALTGDSIDACCSGGMAHHPLCATVALCMRALLRPTSLLLSSLSLSSPSPLAVCLWHHSTCRSCGSVPAAACSWCCCYCCPCHVQPVLRCIPPNPLCIDTAAVLCCCPCCVAPIGSPSPQPPVAPSTFEHHVGKSWSGSLAHCAKSTI
eukprot:SAG25_NODE_577_length_6782_cov_26.651504_3_plen_184_part_00